MLVDARLGLSLGVAEKHAAVAVPTPKPAPGTAFPPRRLKVRDQSVFELNLWCGTCPALFKKLTEPEAADLNIANELLKARMNAIDDTVIGVYGKALPRSQYSALLLEVTPTLVTPGSPRDYFSHEQVSTWGVDPVAGAAEDPGTPYYRTFEAPVGKNGQLYEFVVPMVPPYWNDRRTVSGYLGADDDESGTAVAYSLLDVLQPAVDEGDDHYEHWVLTHFLLDGHHKIEAAAAAARPIRLLGLLDERISIASPEELASMIRALSNAPRPRK